VVGVWTLHKNKRKAICEWWTHPIGGEIRVEISGELVRSEAGRGSRDWRVVGVKVEQIKVITNSDQGR
jgi:hypothetical protein